MSSLRPTLQCLRRQKRSLQLSSPASSSTRLLAPTYAQVPSTSQSAHGYHKSLLHYSSRHATSSAAHDSHHELKEAIDGQSNWSTSYSATRTGLLGEPRLQQPQDFLSLAVETKESAETLAKRIGNARHSSDGDRAELRRVVRNLDRLSDLLCKVIDLAEFIRTAHPDPHWATAAEQAHQYLCSYMNLLNTDTSMYQVSHSLVLTLASH